MPTFIYIDSNKQNENYLLEATVGSTPSLRAYIYQNGTPIAPTATQSSVLYYSVSRESDTGIEIEGTVAVGISYIDYDLSASDLPASGKFFSSIILYDSADDSSVVMSDGMLIIKKNPISN